MATRSVPDNDLNWGPELREVIARKNQLTDDVTGKVPIGQLGTGTPSTSVFLRGDGSFAVPPSATGMSRKNWEDMARTVWAKAPSVESGLTALAVDAATNDQPRIQAMLTYLSATYGRGARLNVPAGTSNVNSGVTLPAGVGVDGVPGESRWDFWNAGTGTFTAITISDNYCTPISGLWISGQQWDANASTANTTTNKGLNITGHTMVFEDVRISGFNQGVDITNDNTYIITFDRCVIENCMVGLNADLSANYHAGTANTNSGESIRLRSSLIANCGTAFWASSNALGLFFSAGTCIDFCNIFGKIRDAHVWFTGCHLESSYTSTPSTMGSDGTPARYLFDLDANPRIYFSDCLFVMGAAGIYYALNALKAPWNLGTGFARFTNCAAAFNANPAASGATAVGFSEPIVAVSTGATTITLASFFVTRWNAMKVAVVAQDGNAAANVSARITAVSSTNGSVTVTFGASAPAGTYIELDC